MFDSRNVVAEITGREKPDEVVLVSGHLDSWDVGQGAMDDGGGCLASWEAVRLMHKLGLRPRRTVRVVLWVNEENGMHGAKSYAEKHRQESPRHVLAMESDSGTFQPTGFTFGGSEQARAVIQQVGSLLEGIKGEQNHFRWRRLGPGTARAGGCAGHGLERRRLKVFLVSPHRGGHRG